MNSKSLNTRLLEEGIRLGLEAAEMSIHETADGTGGIRYAIAIRALDPEAIAREATAKETAR